MIRGLGTDIIEIGRIRLAYEKFAEKLARRILAPEEQDRMAPWSPHRQVEFLAGRFAAKEAMSKACGLGIGRLKMNCVEIRTTEKGLSVFFCPELTASWQTEGVWHVSISHTPEVAYAVAVWED